ncbi:MAG: succinate dehydrogenase cytochrome b subunit [Myxococcota bacterium]
MATKALTIIDTSIGKKMVMAVSGLIMFGFLIGHMAGHLQMFLGPTAYNEYAKFLHDTKPLLWGTRVVLLAAIGAHMVTAAQLYSRNNQARSSRYHVQKDAVTSYAAKAMYLSGPTLLLFIVWHLAHFTLGFSAGLYEHSPPDLAGLPNIYHNMVQSFAVPWMTAIYIFAQVLVGLHLYHGAWSMFQTLGINHRRYNETLRSSASALALAVVAGFIAVPLAIQAGASLGVGPFAADFASLPAVPSP